jgi:flavin reductase (DIM6/NTAB) family NADH-FMN oxidoreductase RutF
VRRQTRVRQSSKLFNFLPQNEPGIKRSFGAPTFAYPLPVFLVGTYDSTGKPGVMAASWEGICSLEPHGIAVSIRPSGYTHKNILAYRAFTISIPAVGQMAEADFFGMVSGSDTNRFAQTMEIGSHTQSTGEILDVKCDKSVLSADGQPDLACIHAICYDLALSDFL